MTITARLAEICRRPVAAADRARAALHVLDWTGCAVAGAATPAGRTLARWGADQAAGPCRVLGGERRDPWTAALVNGAVGNVLEMDDMHRAAVLHPGLVVIPAALALAEREAAPPAVLLDAIVRGYEAMIRVGEAVGSRHRRHWYNTAICGPFGAAAAGCSLLDLDEARWVHAFGNAGTQAAGLRQVGDDPVMSKQLLNGRAAHAGLIAADLAAGGFTGPAAILEGPHGFFAAMSEGARPQDVLLAPDAPWKIHATSFQAWPACRHVHAAIDAALELCPTVEAAAIERVSVRTYADALESCDRAVPRTADEAKFSLQHAVAITLLDGAPALEAFDPASIARADVAALRARVRVERAEPYASAYPGHYGAEVEIETATGRRRAVAADALGDPEKPLDEAGVRAKAVVLMRAGHMDEPSARALAAACLALASDGIVRHVTAFLP